VHKKWLILLLCLFELLACTSPSKHFSQVADTFGFYGFSVNTGLFEHQLYANQAVIQSSSNQKLHIYLDGDGTPWEQQRWVADDPTSRNPLILKLMHQDKSAAIFLGRPCYHGFSKTTACHPKYWTSHRYSQAVVNSLVAALKKCLVKYPFKQLVLMGYSGGGTLAALIAPYFPEMTTLVTVAANLDVDAWSHYHGYSPLSESLNPATFALNARIRQIHLAGLKDTVVPAWIIKTYVDKQVNAIYLPFADFDHHCCWVDEWPKVLLFL
jgi:dienelactone hydrolase